MPRPIKITANMEVMRLRRPRTIPTTPAAIMIAMIRLRPASNAVLHMRNVSMKSPNTNTSATIELIFILLVVCSISSFCKGIIPVSPARTPGKSGNVLSRISWSAIVDAISLSTSMALNVGFTEISRTRLSWEIKYGSP